jgi:hypothetical protein
MRDQVGPVSMVDNPMRDQVGPVSSPLHVPLTPEPVVPDAGPTIPAPTSRPAVSSSRIYAWCAYFPPVFLLLFVAVCQVRRVERVQPSPRVVDNPMREEQPVQLRVRSPSSPPKPLSPQRRPFRDSGRTSSHVLVWDSLVTGSPQRGAAPIESVWTPPSVVHQPTTVMQLSPHRLAASPGRALSGSQGTAVVRSGMSAFQKDTLLRTLRVETSASAAPSRAASPLQRSQMPQAAARSLASPATPRSMTVLSPTGKQMRVVGGLADDKWAAKVKSL